MLHFRTFLCEKGLIKLIRLRPERLKHSMYLPFIFTWSVLVRSEAMFTTTGLSESVVGNKTFPNLKCLRAWDKTFNTKGDFSDAINEAKTTCIFPINLH